MNASREILEGQSERYAEKLRETNSYIKELKARTADHGTDEAHFEEDLQEAEHNVKYYEDENARIEGALKDSRGPSGAQTVSGAQQAVSGALLPRAVKQGSALCSSLQSLSRPARSSARG